MNNQTPDENPRTNNEDKKQTLVQTYAVQRITEDTNILKKTWIHSSKEMKINTDDEEQTRKHRTGQRVIDIHSSWNFLLTNVALSAGTNSTCF